MCHVAVSKPNRNSLWGLGRCHGKAGPLAKTKWNASQLLEVLHLFRCFTHTMHWCTIQHAAVESTIWPTSKLQLQGWWNLIPHSARHSDDTLYCTALVALQWIKRFFSIFVLPQQVLRDSIVGTKKQLCHYVPLLHCCAATAVQLRRGHRQHFGHICCRWKHSGWA